jgi:hypothetical protein
MAPPVTKIFKHFSEDAGVKSYGLRVNFCKHKLKPVIMTEGELGTVLRMPHSSPVLA